MNILKKKLKNEGLGEIFYDIHNSLSMLIDSKLKRNLCLTVFMIFQLYSTLERKIHTEKENTMSIYQNQMSIYLFLARENLSSFIFSLR